MKEQNLDPHDSQSRIDQLVVRLRRIYNMTEDTATDQEILDASEGTLGRALEELDMASDELGGVLHDEIRATKGKMQTKIGEFIRRNIGA